MANTGSEISRRQCMVGGAAAMLAGGSAAFGAPARRFFARHHLPIGVQLYTVSDAARSNLEGTFARLAQIGFRSVELAGFHGATPSRLRAAADRHHLEITSAHISAEPYEPGPALKMDLPRLAADLHLLGTRRAVMPMFLMPDRPPPRKIGSPADLLAWLDTMTLSDWQRSAAFLNEKGAALRGQGIELGYHNHGFEFRPVEGTTGFDVIVRETDPAIFLELDAGWAAAAGQDLPALLTRLKGRMRMMHVKDIMRPSRPNYTFEQQPAEVGKGSIDWPSLLPIAYATGVRDFFVEQEPPFTMDRFAALKLSFDYLSACRTGA